MGCFSLAVVTVLFGVYWKPAREWDWNDQLALQKKTMMYDTSKCD